MFGGWAGRKARTAPTTSSSREFRRPGSPAPAVSEPGAAERRRASRCDRSRGHGAAGTEPAFPSSVPVTPAPNQRRPSGRRVGVRG